MVGDHLDFVQVYSLTLVLFTQYLTSQEIQTITVRIILQPTLYKLKIIIKLSVILYVNFTSLTVSAHVVKIYILQLVMKREEVVVSTLMETIFLRLAAMLSSNVIYKQTTIVHLLKTVDVLWEQILQIRLVLHKKRPVVLVIVNSLQNLFVHQKQLVVNAIVEILQLFINQIALLHSLCVVLLYLKNTNSQLIVMYSDPCSLKLFALILLNTHLVLMTQQMARHLNNFSNMEMKVLITTQECDRLTRETKTLAGELSEKQVTHKIVRL